MPMTFRPEAEIQGTSWVPGLDCAFSPSKYDIIIDATRQRNRIGEREVGFKEIIAGEDVKVFLSEGWKVLLVDMSVVFYESAGFQDK